MERWLIMRAFGTITTRAMIRFAAPVFLLTMMTGTLPADPSATSQPAALKTFGDKTDGFTLDHPAAWKESDSKSSPQLKLSLEPAGELHVSVLVEVAPTTLPADHVKSITDKAVNYFKTGMGELVSDDAVEVDGLPGRQIVFLDNREAQKEHLEVVTIKDGKLYTILYMAPPPDFDKYRPDVDALLKSFKWTAAAK